MYQCLFLDNYFFDFFRKNELSASKCRRVMAGEPELNLPFLLILRTCDSQRCISAFGRPDNVCGLAPVGSSVLLLLALYDPQEEK